MASVYFRRRAWGWGTLVFVATNGILIAALVALVSTAFAITYVFVAGLVALLAYLATAPAAAMKIYDTLLDSSGIVRKSSFILAMVAVVAALSALVGLTVEPFMWTKVSPRDIPNIAPMFTHVLVSSIICILIAGWYAFGIYRTVNIVDGDARGDKNIVRVVNYIQQKTEFGKDKTLEQVHDALRSEIVRGRLQVWARESGKAKTIQIFPKVMRHYCIRLKGDSVRLISDKREAEYHGLCFRKIEVMALWPPVDASVDW